MISIARCRADRYCSAATKASLTPAREAVTAAGSSRSAVTSASGSGCSHGTSDATSNGASGSPVGPPRPDGSGRMAAPLDRGQAHIGCDPIQPSPHRRPALEPLIRPPRPQERLLDQVLGLIHRTHHPVTVSQQLTAEPAGQTGEILADRHQPLQFVRRPATCRPSTYRPDDRRRIAAHPRPAHDLPLGPRRGTAATRQNLR